MPMLIDLKSDIIECYIFRVNLPEYNSKVTDSEIY